MYNIVRFNNYLDGTLRGFIDSDFQRFFGRVWPAINQESTAFPACGIEETEKGYFVSLDVPGVKHHDISIEVHGRLLEVEASRRPLTKQTESEQHSNPTYKRAFEFPESANLDKIEATCEDGVLTIAVAKQEASKSKKITVGQGNSEIFKKFLEVKPDS